MNVSIDSDYKYIQFYYSGRIKFKIVCSKMFYFQIGLILLVILNFLNQKTQKQNGFNVLKPFCFLLML